MGILTVILLILCVITVATPLKKQKANQLTDQQKSMYTLLILLLAFVRASCFFIALVDANESNDYAVENQYM